MRKFIPFSAQLLALGFKTYNCYLKSKHWKLFKKQCLLFFDPFVCFVCKNKAEHIHHITYDRLGDELLGDVIPICESCHKIIYDITKSKQAKLEEAHILARKLYDLNLDHNLYPIVSTNIQELTLDILKCKNEKQLDVFDLERTIFSDYFSHISSADPNTFLYLTRRVSSREQKGNLVTQTILLNEIAKNHNCVAVGGEEHSWSGRGLVWELKFEGVCQRAQKLGAHLFFTDTTRIIRHLKYKSTDAELRKLQATVIQSKTMVDIADKYGVKIYTAIHPNSSNAEIQSIMIKAGQRTKGKMGGGSKSRYPGYKKAQRIKMLDTVLSLRNAGNSMGQISKITGIIKPTIQLWIQKYLISFKTPCRKTLLP